MRYAPSSQDKYFVTLDKFSDKKDPKLKEKFMSRVVAPVADLEEGFTNFKKLLAEEGGDVTILGLTEGEEIKWILVPPLYIRVMKESVIIGLILCRA